MKTYASIVNNIGIKYAQSIYIVLQPTMTSSSGSAKNYDSPKEALEALKLEYPKAEVINTSKIDAMMKERRETNTQAYHEHKAKGGTWTNFNSPYKGL